MIKLISIELMKIFKHKSIYIVLSIIFMFCLLNDFLYKNDYDEDGNYKYEDKINLDNYMEKLENQNKKYDLNKESDKFVYITNKTKIDVAKIQKKYNYNDWRYIKANDYLYEDVYNINYYKYIEKNDDSLKQSMTNYNKKMDNFLSDNWIYFVNIEKENLEEELRKNDKLIADTDNKEEKNNLEEKKINLENDLIIVNYRIDKNINYSNTYLNKALEDYRQNLSSFNEYKKINSMNYDNKLEYNKITSNLNINRYIIENKKNVNKPNTLNYQLRTIVDDYELFIIIIILIVSSILIGEEFNKGTIKLLLIKPYKRSKILLSKYVACIILTFFVIIFIILCQLIIGGCLFGFDSLSMGVVSYDFVHEKLIIINIFMYMLLRILVKLPMLVIVITISFLLGIILNSVIGAFSITMILYTFSEVINSMAIEYNLKFMKYFITLNWNFKDYLFGGLSTYKYLDLKNSILIFLIYVIMLLGAMFISFNKKNIKNI